MLEKGIAPVRARTDADRWRADVEAGRALGVDEALAEALAP